TEGLSLRLVGRSVAAALGKLPSLPEWQEPGWLAQQGWPSFGNALRALHHPPDLAALSPAGPDWSRLAYDELLAGQLALALVRAHVRRPSGRRHAGDGSIRKRILAALPFALTASQVNANADIAADLEKPERMLRLVQGDVGSGKTVVALLAAAAVVEAGRQTALMAPTEILARQHHATIAPLAEAAGLRVVLVTGRERGRERDAALAAMAAGEVDIAIGTHALFQESVTFKDLGLAIVDEQHRFGVQQRLALSNKGEAVDMLVLTATPIPRTLVLTYFGDMDSSQLREKPAGRKPIETRTISLSRLSEVVDGVGRAMSEGQRVYWVCPLVAESEESDLAAAEERFAFLHARFGDRVALIHGKMKGAEKDHAMARFASGDATLLVATTVIEVGVNVPEATVMVIEHA
ncbi:MAG: DEAD/DEAH box helicase, partial [Rhizobiales bacterium]|nr:DEAD/DEAH box helicase [Hyphomicrobiales bacterium]